MKDLTGKKFGRWAVLEFSHKDKGHYYWKSRCSCGTIKTIRLDNKPFSCGCYVGERAKKENTLPNNQAFWNKIFYIYKRAAQLRNYYFDLTIEEVKEICLGECWYCGRVASEDNRNGIDRVDNSEGYTIDNTVSCCKECNVAKNDMSASDFIAHAARIVEHQKKLNGEE